jgi:hypothetical protein
MWLKKKKKNENENKDIYKEKQVILTQKTDINVKEVTLNPSETLKKFVKKERIERIPPARYGTYEIQRLDIDKAIQEENIFEDSKKPMEDVYQVFGLFKEATIQIVRYSNVHNGIRKGKIIYDFGSDSRTLFNFVYEDETNGLLENENLFAIYCFEQDVAHAKEYIRLLMINRLNTEKSNIEDKINKINEL